jgi:hypothetical protein
VNVRLLAKARKVARVNLEVDSIDYKDGGLVAPRVNVSLSEYVRRFQ